VRELFHAIGLNGVLIEGVACSTADAEILSAWRKEDATGRRFHPRTQPVDDLRCACLADLQWFQRDVDEAAIRSSLTAGKANYVLDTRIGLDYAGQLAQRVIHDRERCVLRPANCALQGPCVLLRENPLGLLTISTKFNAIVSNSTARVGTGCSSTHASERR